MTDIKELKDEELEKVSGGASAAEISELVDMLQRIRNNVSSNTNLIETIKDNTLYYLNWSISCANANNISAARNYFYEAQNHIVNYGSSFSFEFTDDMNYVGLLFSNLS